MAFGWFRTGSNSRITTRGATPRIGVGPRSSRLHMGGGMAPGMSGGVGPVGGYVSLRGRRRRKRRQHSDDDTPELPIAPRSARAERRAIARTRHAIRRADEKVNKLS